MFTRTVVLAAVMTLGLSACGDDDEAKNQVAKGVVADWTVSGLHYATDTQSGLTSATGEFSYKSGESVTFSLGGTMLATVAGAERVTLFDMFGIAAPTSELEIRAARRKAHPQAFDRVANAAALLFALDADHDASNGIDLGDWNTTLAEETLSLERKMEEFAYRDLDRLGAAYAGIYRFPANPPIVMLYDSMGVRVAAHAVTTTTTTRGGVNDNSWTVAYDNRGRSLVERYDRDLDGADEYVQTTSFNTLGQQVTASYESDEDDNNTLESRELYAITYAELGVEKTNTTTRSTSGVNTMRRERTYTHDARGNVMLDELTSDAFADGSIDARETTTWTRDARGLPVTELTESREVASGPVTDRRTSRYVHDAAGRMTSEVEEPDTNADGVIDSSYTQLYTYDAQGRVLTSTREYRDSGGTLTSRSVTTLTYDASGNATNEVYESDGDANGAVDNRYTTVTSYNANGQPLLATIEEDNGANNTVDRRSVRTWTYDANGFVQQQRRETDDDGNGSVDYSTTYDWTYDASGAALTNSETSTELIGGTRVETNTLTVIDDGLMYLLRERLNDGGEMAE